LQGVGRPRVLVRASLISMPFVKRRTELRKRGTIRWPPGVLLVDIQTSSSATSRQHSARASPDRRPVQRNNGIRKHSSGLRTAASIRSSSPGVSQFGSARGSGGMSSA
jgi:hypothetical protein